MTQVISRRLCQLVNRWLSSLGKEGLDLFCRCDPGGECPRACRKTDPGSLWEAGLTVPGVCRNVHPRSRGTATANNWEGRRHVRGHESAWARPISQMGQEVAHS